MFIDFRVVYSKATAETILSEAVGLGYDGVAFTTIIDKLGPNTFKNHKKDQCKVVQRPVRRRGRLRLKNDLATFALGIPPDQNDEILQISRLHVAVTGTNESSQVHQFIRTQCSNVTTGADVYDIVSMEVNDEKAWHHALGQGVIDMLTVDLYDARLPFTIRRAQLKLAARQNIYMEICLDRALQDGGSCRQLFRNLPYITRYLPTSQLILTSGANAPLGLRAPEDLVALLQMLGYHNIEDARRIMRQNTKELLTRAAARRCGAPVYPVNTEEEETMVDR